MKYHTSISLLLLFVFALAPLALEAGTVKALRVVGQVELVEEATGRTAPLRTGQIFGEGNTVVTHAASNAILVFSNGSTLNVASESSVRVETLIQEAFSPAMGEFQALTEEPSQSETRVHLNYGEVTGRSRLREGSSFDIATDVGVAGIRGSIVQVRLETVTTPDGRERRVMTVAVLEGDQTVGVWSVNVSEIAEFRPLEEGTVAEISFDDETGEVVFSPLTAAQTSRIISILEAIQNAIDDAEPGDPQPDIPDFDFDDEDDEESGRRDEHRESPDLELPGISPF